MDHKRIFLFTNDDNPLKGDADETKKVHMIAQVTDIAYGSGMPRSRKCSVRS